MSEGEQARAAALHFEATKVSMRQDGKGCYITLAIHPSEVPVDLFGAHPGSRFMVAMALLDDHDNPVKGPDTIEGERAVQSAAMLCRNPKFQKWVYTKNFAMTVDEESAANAIKDLCSIDSRADLKTNRDAREIFMRIKQEFERTLF
jgi:hypothetical protein